MEAGKGFPGHTQMVPVGFAYWEVKRQLRFCKGQCGPLLYPAGPETAENGDLEHFWIKLLLLGLLKCDGCWVLALKFKAGHSIRTL